MREAELRRKVDAALEFVGGVLRLTETTTTPAALERLHALRAFFLEVRTLTGATDPLEALAVLRRWRETVHRMQ